MIDLVYTYVDRNIRLWLHWFNTLIVLNGTLKYVLSSKTLDRQKEWVFTSYMYVKNAFCKEDLVHLFRTSLRLIEDIRFLGYNNWLTLDWILLHWRCQSNELAKFPKQTSGSETRHGFLRTSRNYITRWIHTDIWRYWNFIIIKVFTVI